MATHSRAVHSDAMTRALDVEPKNEGFQLFMAVKASASTQLPAAKMSPSRIESASQGTGPR